MEDRYDRLRLDRQLCFPLYAAAREVMNLYTPVLQPLGLTYTEYLVFLVLWERDGSSVSEVGKRLHLNNGTLTPLLQRMERDGHLTRTRAAADQRVVLLHLTEQGRQLREKALSVPERVGKCIRLPQEKGGEPLPALVCASRRVEDTAPQRPDR
jgi:DNA-binding MarR family transcriptional regulator